MDKTPKYIVVNKGTKKQAVAAAKKKVVAAKATPKKAEEKPMPQALK
jgi:ribosomal protein L30E